MKMRKKCGAHYPDNKMFCIDCNEKLSDRLTESEEEQVKANLNRKIEINILKMN